MLPVVLYTKLFIPQITNRHIKREALYKKLLKGHTMDRHVTLVCAPAGYGKTTLVLELLSVVEEYCAWISLDESDNDVSTFLAYIAAAVKKAGIDIGNDILYLASDVNLNYQNIILTEIVNKITQFEAKVVLVLDDYHLIKSQGVNNLVKFLLENQPPNLHIIITSREDPQLQLSRMRVNERITEIRMGELCFSPKESSEFYKKIVDVEINTQAIEMITSATEGWIAGMQLTGLLFEGLKEEQVEAAISKLSSNHSYIIDYLVEEVLDKQNSEVREFLCKTSVLERMNGELCDELTGRTNGQNMLRQLEKANLFLMPLDSNREWYRYHNLFACSLRIELSDEEEKSLYGKAAGWMMKKGFYIEAVSYAFKSGDLLMAQNMVEGCTKEMFQNAQLVTLIKWMEQLPAEMLKKSEILAVRKAIAYFITGKVKEAVEHIRYLGEDFENHTSPHNKGLILSLKALMASHSGKDAEQYASDALKLLEPWDPIARTSMFNTLGKAQYFKGRTEEALNTFKHAYDTGFQMGYTFVTTLALLNYGICLDAMGKSGEALRAYKEYMQGMEQKFGKHLPFIGIIYIALAELYYERNELDDARQYMDKGMELCRSFSYNWLDASTTYANIKFASGEKDEAVKNLKSLLESNPGPGMHENRNSILGTLVHQLLRMGKPDEAQKYKDLLQNHVEDRTQIGWENAVIAYSRLLIQMKELHKAEGMLCELERTLTEGLKIKSLITVLILRSEVLYKRHTDEHMEYLNRAIVYAAQGEYLRPFLDEEALTVNASVAQILDENTGISSFVGKLSKYYSNQSVKQVDQCSDQVYQRPVETVKNTFTLDYGEKFSEREMEILLLISKGKSNGEIAKELFISTNTIQWHISHIYSKLGVRSRTQAILKAKDLGVLNS